MKPLTLSLLSYFIPHPVLSFPKLKKVTTTLIFVTLLMPVLTFANENGETSTTNDIGLLSTWAISQLTRGGYIKTETGVSAIDNDVNGLLSLNGGWRLTQHVKLGFSLNSTVKDVSAVNAKIVTIGPTLGFTGFQKTLGQYSFDFTLGAAYANNAEATDFYEPSLYLINKIPNISIKRMFWTSGVSYQKIGGIGPNSVKSHHLSSINFKLGLVFGSY